MSRFEMAVDAVVCGDVAALKGLIREDAGLVRERSLRTHRATLLHYVAANGVEDERQQAPANIIEVTTVLLDAGAEVDATAPMYGAEWTTLGLAATSAHPEKAGVQEDLLDLLLARGAKMPPGIVKSCLDNGRGKAAAFLAGRGAEVGFVEAAGLGRMDLVRDLIGLAQPEEIAEGFRKACAFGRDAVVEFLLAGGVDLKGAGKTGLHWAVIGGHAETVALLLRHGAPLEAKGEYDSTPLGQGLWSVAHGGETAVYLRIFDMLAGAGARVPERFRPIHPKVDAWLELHGSVLVND